MLETYKGTELPLLTDDINEIKAMVNKFRELDDIRSRIFIETPRLVNNAKELIELLKDEYSD